jgi:hypothetical protein
MRTFTKIEGIMALMFIVLGALFAAGCAGEASPSPAEQKQLQQTADKAANQLKLQQQKERLEQAKADPIRHPLAWFDVIILKLKTPLIAIAILSFIAAAVGFGFKSYLGAVGTMLIRVGLRVFIGTLATLIALPWFPVAFYALLAGFGVWFVVEVIIKKGNVPSAIDALESDLKPVIGEVTTETAPAALSASVAKVATEIPNPA